MAKSDAEILALAGQVDINKIDAPHKHPWQIADGMLCELLEVEDKLSDWEQSFVNSLIEWVAKNRAPSTKQWNVLDKIYVKYVNHGVR